jgi:hypothetical protein
MGTFRCGAEAMWLTKINSASAAQLLMFLFLAVPTDAHAYIILLDHPYPDRVATADVVAFGRITSQEKRAASTCGS